MKVAMPNIKSGDFVKSVAKTTGLSLTRAKKVVKAAGVDLGYVGRTLSKDKEKKAASALSGAIKKFGYKVVGMKDERKFKQKIIKGNTQFKQNPAKPEANDKKSLTSATDFLAKVRQGIPGSKESESKEPQAVVSGNALGRQVPEQKPTVGESPKIRAQRVPLSDNFANIEAIANHEKGNEPVAPDIG